MANPTIEFEHLMYFEEELNYRKFHCQNSLGFVRVMVADSRLTNMSKDSKGICSTLLVTVVRVIFGFCVGVFLLYNIKNRTIATAQILNQNTIVCTHVKEPKCVIFVGRPSHARRCD